MDPEKRKKFLIEAALKRQRYNKTQNAFFND
jgi:hypothetical protein